MRSPMSCMSKHLCNIVSTDSIAPATQAAPTPLPEVSAPVQAPLQIQPQMQPPAQAAPSFMPPAPGQVRTPQQQTAPAPATPTAAIAGAMSLLPPPGQVRSAQPPAHASPGASMQSALPSPSQVAARVAAQPAAAPLLTPPGKIKITAPEPVAPAEPLAPESATVSEPAQESTESFALDDFVDSSAPVEPQPTQQPEPAPYEPVFTSTAHVPATPTLIVSGAKFPLANGSIIGREGDVARDHFKLDKTVSRAHVRVDVFASGDVALLNLASTGNPVIINNVDIPFNQSGKLHPGSNSVQLGTRFVFQIVV